MSHEGNDYLIDKKRDEQEMIINPKDYPNTSALFGYYPEEPKKLSKFQENLKKEREFERKKRAITNFIYGFKS